MFLREDCDALASVILHVLGENETQEKKTTLKRTTMIDLASVVSPWKSQELQKLKRKPRKGTQLHDCVDLSRGGRGA